MKTLTDLPTQTDLPTESYTLSRLVDDASDGLIRNVLSGELRELHELAALEADWDGNDAPPVSRQTLSLASDLLMVSALFVSRQGLKWKSPDIAPTPDGGIYLHWADITLSCSANIAPHGEVITLLINRAGERAVSAQLTILNDAAYVIANYIERQQSPVSVT